MSRPPQTPAEAASLHLRLVREFKMTWFQNYMRLFWDTYYDDNDRVIPVRAINRESGQEFHVEKHDYTQALIESLRDHLNGSETVFVTSDIVHVIETMGKSMPEDMLLADDVPWEDMTLFFERDVVYEEFLGDDQWKTTRIRAIHIAKNQPIRSWGNTMARGIMITLFAAKDIIDPSLVSDADLVVIDMTGWKFEQMWGISSTVVNQRNHMWESGDDRQPHEISPHVAAMRKFLLCLLRFMAEEIIQVSRHPMSRAQKRRAAREDFEIPEDGCITTVHLRKVRYVGESEPSGTVREFSHRFWVDGHVRHLDYLEPGRTTWIRPYLKGPDGAPIVMKQRVITINR